MIFSLWFIISFKKAKLSSLEEASLFLVNTTQPIQKIINSPIKAFSDLFSFFHIRKNYYLLKEKEILFTQDVAKIEELKNENDLLLNTLNIKKSDTNYLFAKALKTGTDKYTFLINKGKNHNVKLSTNVVIQDNILIGKVIEVYKNSALVESIYSPNISIGVINTFNNQVGLLKKDSLGNLIITLYSEDEYFKQGDIIKTSLENTDFVQGLLIGKVSQIKIESTYQNIIIEPFFKFANLSNVMLIIE
ncbi:MAG: rod shape-determining protein MreC [Candidatus Pacebacteria bacterium]|nr:rod shape-determining protein MreC [Candidatus Paceibacterota bacterium]